MCDIVLSTCNSILYLRLNVRSTHLLVAQTELRERIKESNLNKIDVIQDGSIKQHKLISCEPHISLNTRDQLNDLYFN